MALLYSNGYRNDEVMDEEGIPEGGRLRIFFSLALCHFMLHWNNIPYHYSLSVSKNLTVSVSRMMYNLLLGFEIIFYEDLYQVT